MLAKSGLLMNYGLPPEIEEMRNVIRRWVDDVLIPIADDIDKSNEFPRHLWPQLGDMGLHGITVSEANGGVGLGYLAQVVATEEISRGSAAIGLSYLAHSNLCINQIELNGSAEQKKKYLPKLISGEHVGSLAMSETGAGSDVVGMKLKAEDKGDHYLLNGTKMWITNSPHAEVLVVYAKTDSEAGSRGITTFIIEKSYEGFSVSPKLDKLGMRGSDTAELVFNDCKVPKENVLGKVGGGVRVLMSGLDYERIMVAACSVGIIEASLDLALPYVRERKQFGQPIGEFQLVQAKIADMYTALGSSRAYVYAAAQAADRGEITRQDAAACFLLASEQATQMALHAVQLMGGNGYMNDCPAGRFVRDAKLLEIGGGTTEIRRMLIGRELVRKTQ